MWSSLTLHPAALSFLIFKMKVDMKFPKWFQACGCQHEVEKCKSLCSYSLNSLCSHRQGLVEGSSRGNVGCSWTSKFMQRSKFPFIALLTRARQPRKPRPVICLCHNTCVPQESGEFAAYLCSGISYGLYIPLRFALIASISGQDVCDSSLRSSCVGFLPVLSKKSQTTVMQTDKAAILKASISGTTPTAEVPSLHKALAW